MVGDDSLCSQYPKPIGKIAALDQFMGSTYFEVDADYFSDERNLDIVLEFSVWANGGGGDCDSGTKLEVFTTEISHLCKFCRTLIVTNALSRCRRHCVLVLFKKDPAIVSKSRDIYLLI